MQCALAMVVVHYLERYIPTATFCFVSSISQQYALMKAPIYTFARKSVGRASCLSGPATPDPEMLSHGLPPACL